MPCAPVGPEASTVTEPPHPPVERSAAVRGDSYCDLRWLATVRKQERGCDRRDGNAPERKAAAMGRWPLAPHQIVEAITESIRFGQSARAWRRRADPMELADTEDAGRLTRRRGLLAVGGVDAFVARSMAKVSELPAVETASTPDVDVHTRRRASVRRAVAIDAAVTVDTHVRARARRIAAQTNTCAALGVDGALIVAARVAACSQREVAPPVASLRAVRVDLACSSARRLRGTWITRGRAGRRGLAMKRRSPRRRRGVSPVRRR